MAVFVLVAAGCREWPEVDLERMIDQRYFRPFERSELFDDQRAMRTPPLGTIPRGRALGPSALVEGVSADRYVEAIPVPLERAQLERGRNRYEIYCSVCHGPAGRGETVVAYNMTLRQPPSLLAEPVRGYPPGRIFAAITRGYGLMPSYAEELPLADRWAVVAYVQVLQLSQQVKLGDLPPRLRAEAGAALR